MRLSIFAVFVISAALAAEAQSVRHVEVGDGQFQVVFEPADAEVAARVAELVLQGRNRIATFFGAGFEQPVEVHVLADRRAFDRFLKDRWGMPATECWMVAAADATAVPLLSPRAWPTEACEHDARNERHLAYLLTHELVHAYQGQHNPKPDLSVPDEMGWFVEGVAVYVSGQLDEGHFSDPAEAIANGKEPRRLADAWSGRYRYGVSGTLVEYVDRKAGRATIRRGLSATSAQQLLDALGITEEALLAGWRTFVLGDRR